MSAKRIACDKCGKVYGIGDSPFCRDGHERVLPYHPFTHYFDIGLGAEVTSLAQRKRLMRQNRLDYRDHPSPGDVSARADRAQEARKLTGRT